MSNANNVTAVDFTSAKTVARHYEASGSPLQEVINCSVHLDFLLTDEQKRLINWHAEQSLQLAVMRIISEWTETLARNSALQSRLTLAEDALDNAYDELRVAMERAEDY